MSSTAQLEMQIHGVKDKLAAADARLDNLHSVCQYYSHKQQRLEDYESRLNDIKKLLTELRSKL
jgi:hypothetical protein